MIAARSTNFNKHSISNNNFTQSPKKPSRHKDFRSKKRNAPNLYWQDSRLYLHQNKRSNYISIDHQARRVNCILKVLK